MACSDPQNLKKVAPLVLDDEGTVLIEVTTWQDKEYALCSKTDVFSQVENGFHRNTDYTGEKS